MEFNKFFKRCQNEPTVSDFESYLSYCIFEKKSAKARGQDVQLCSRPGLRAARRKGGTAAV